LRRAGGALRLPTIRSFQRRDRRRDVFVLQFDQGRPRRQRSKLLTTFRKSVIPSSNSTARRTERAVGALRAFRPISFGTTTSSSSRRRRPTARNRITAGRSALPTRREKPRAGDFNGESRIKKALKCFSERKQRLLGREVSAQVWKKLLKRRSARKSRSLKRELDAALSFRPGIDWRKPRPRRLARNSARVRGVGVTSRSEAVAPKSFPSDKNNRENRA